MALLEDPGPLQTDRIFDALAAPTLEYVRGRVPALQRHLQSSRAASPSALDRFADLYQTGDLPEYHKIVNTLIAHMPQILAWHTAGRASNGRIEGTNNLLQVLRRTARGFTNTHNFVARALLVT